MTTRILAAFLFCFLAAATGRTDTVTLTTYYPSPGGIYETLTAGNIGVGTTTTTAARLTVTGNGTAAALVGGLTCGGTNLAAIGFGNALACGSYALSASGTDLYLNRPAGGNLLFRQNNSNQMVLDATGNLGIGTTAPTANLQVPARITLGTSANANNNYSVSATSAGGLAYLSLANNGYGAPSLFIEQGGNVGIGNSLKPSAAPLTVHGASGTGAVYIWGGNNAGAIALGPEGGMDARDYSLLSDGTNTYLNSPAGSIIFELDNTTHMTLRPNGNLGIGDATPEYKLEVNGDVGANFYYHNSDIRLKEKIAPLQAPLDRVRRLKGVNFVFKDTPQQRRMGMIAQQVESVAPEVVKTAASGMKSVDYAALVALLVEGMKEQQLEITALKARVGALESR